MKVQVGLRIEKEVADKLRAHAVERSRVTGFIITVSDVIRSAVREYFRIKDKEEK